MTTTLKLCVAFALSALVAGCPPVPAPPGPDADAAPLPMMSADAPSAEAVDDDGCMAFCATLAAAGCPEGSIYCVSTCSHVVAAHLTKLPIACVTHVQAVDVTQVRACGVRCGAQ
ncbi:MAG: hypothetical protein NVS3B7_16780 [Candidatus Elarobacter sp.]